MDPTQTRMLGTSGLKVTQLGLGCASFGSLNHVVPEEDALGAIRAAWDAGIRYFDTAPWYGRGLSELRTGAGLRYKPRDEFILSTKVGRWLTPQIPGSVMDRGMWKAPNAFDVVFDYTYDGIMRAFEQSQHRLGLPWVDVTVIHDLDSWHHAYDPKLQAYFDQLMTSGWRAITELRAHGLIRAVGAGINHLGLIPRFMDIVDVDFFLIAMPYTLLRQEMLEEFPACVERGIGLVIGAPFQSGILATGSRGGASANYSPPTPELLAQVERIEAVCARHDVPLAAAALQFVMGHPSVATVIPGARSAAHVERNVASFRHEIPADLWAELKHEGLLRDDAPVPA
jgi:D-threo-aldose 1-dehydrogenase